MGAFILLLGHGLLSRGRVLVAVIVQREGPEHVHRKPHQLRYAPVQLGGIEHVRNAFDLDRVVILIRGLIDYGCEEQLQDLFRFRCRAIRLGDDRIEPPARGLVRRTLIGAAKLRSMFNLNYMGAIFHNLDDRDMEALGYGEGQIRERAISFPSLNLFRKF